jgi:hypothetical protein
VARVWKQGDTKTDNVNECLSISIGSVNSCVVITSFGVSLAKQWMSHLFSTTRVSSPCLRVVGRRVRCHKCQLVNK